MTALFKRLMSSVAAYQVADVISKLTAVLLLPVYTRYIHPAGYGVVELLANGVILISIVVRFGMIEAFLRFYFTDADPERRDALVRRTAGFLLVATSVVAIVLAAFSAPLSTLVLSHRDTATFLIAVLGMWSFTNLELAYGLLRVDERLRTYAIASVSNVVLTIAGSVILVVGFGDGPRGLLGANYGVSTIILLALWWTMRQRLAPRRAGAQRLRILLRFGLPTVPAEASVYALSIVDRYYLYHGRGQAMAGLYSIAVKLAGSVAFIVRAFQYAWPPLAYSITSDAQAARFYGLVTTYYVLVSGWVVAGLTLLSRWVLRVLAAPAYAGAHRALPWLALGWALYGLWVIFLVVAGRAQVTMRTFPAAIAGLAVNVGLLVALVGPLGLAGAGIALCGAYAVMLGVMFTLTRNAFRVDFEWGRLVRLVLVLGVLAVLGDLLLPGQGAAGLISRIAVVLAIGPVLAATGFVQAAELVQVRGLLDRARRGRGARGAPGER